MTGVLSIDVEDWFHILDIDTAPAFSLWNNLPSRVEENFQRLLDILDESAVTATCFFLGWIAETYPHLVREAARRGHEIAAHGYAHQLVYGQTPDEFLADITRAKRLLEDVIGASIQGYRAPGFSIVKRTPWAFEVLVEAGYRYDSSVFPTSRGHGGMAGAPIAPYTVETRSGGIVEFPISVVNVLGRRVCCFGGGYFRLAPYPLIRLLARRIEREGRPVIYYLHPRDIDPEQPRIAMPPVRRFRTYVSLAGTERKLRRLVREATLVPFRALLGAYPA